MKAAGFRKPALQRLGKMPRFLVKTTEDAKDAKGTALQG